MEINLKTAAAELVHSQFIFLAPIILDMRIFHYFVHLVSCVG